MLFLYNFEGIWSIDQRKEWSSGLDHAEKERRRQNQEMKPSSPPRRKIPAVKKSADLVRAQPKKRCQEERALERVNWSVELGMGIALPASGDFTRKTPSFFADLQDN